VFLATSRSSLGTKPYTIPPMIGPVHCHHSHSTHAENPAMKGCTRPQHTYNAGTIRGPYIYGMVSFLSIETSRTIRECFTVVLALQQSLTARTNIRLNATGIVKKDRSNQRLLSSSLANKSWLFLSSSPSYRSSHTVTGGMAISRAQTPQFLDASHIHFSLREPHLDSYSYIDS
jgi:hypothetical protein